VVIWVSFVADHLNVWPGARGVASPRGGCGLNPWVEAWRFTARSLLLRNLELADLGYRIGARVRKNEERTGRRRPDGQ
jgi:hypothetical protein